MSKYPVLKVFLSFSLVPMWGGLSMGLIFLFTSPVSDAGGIFWNVWFQFVMLLLTMTVSLFFGVVPAAILGILYALSKIKRGMMSYVFVFICGGVVAYVWSNYIFGFYGNDALKSFEHVRPIIIQNLPSKAFVLGAVFSALTAMVVLPVSKGEQRLDA